MKSIMLPMSLFASGILLFTSCAQGPSGDKVNSSEASEVAQAGENGVTYTVDTEKSVIEWEGAKLTYGHNGLISLSEGAITMEGDQITAGSFTIDMNSLVCLDIEDSDKNAQLVGHLLSADFFEAETYPYAKFDITGAEKVADNMYTISGNLTMKEISREIQFQAEVVSDGEMFSSTTPQFVIDRSEWNVRFGSTSFFDDLKDDFIKNEIGLVVKLVARK